MLHIASSSHVVWLNRDVPSAIGWTQLIGVHSYLGIMSVSLIEDEEVDRMATTNFHLFTLSFFESVKYSWMFRSIKPFTHHNP